MFQANRKINFLGKYCKPGYIKLVAVCFKYIFEFFVRKNIGDMRMVLARCGGVAGIVAGLHVRAGPLQGPVEDAVLERNSVVLFSRRSGKAP